ncbi:hypothetical protein [Sulfurirhabdus autotrophica]|nr:hypothetical protein [Sulfurirhabdus autotrophica]
MTSTRQSFTTQGQCPVIGRPVSLSGIRVSLIGSTAIAEKTVQMQ